MPNNKPVSLRVSIPVCSFRKPYAREYLETEQVPFPSTVYGFLLSLIGEEDRDEYIGTCLSIAVVRQPVISTVLRTTWRIKTNAPPGTGNNRKPDYQQILTGLEISIWVAAGELTEKLAQACENFANITRFGGLSLGESRDLVDEVEFFPCWSDKEAVFLVKDERGQHALPVWVDHVGSKGTKWGQFSLEKQPLTLPPEKDLRWIEITP